jgi:uncharacterized protein with GYD domain
MPLFVGLGKVTETGAKNLTEWAARLESTIDGLPQHVKVHNVYFTIGSYDVVVVAEGRSAEDMMAVSAETAGYGLVRFETMLAVPAADFAKTIKK